MRFFRVARASEPPEKILEAAYKSCHHVNVPSGAGVETHIFYMPDDLPKDLSDCTDNCECRRIPLKIAQRISQPLQNLPMGVKADYFCLELEGVCCFETIGEARAFYNRNAAWLTLAPSHIIEFEGNLIGEVYDGLVALPERIITVHPI